MPNVIDPTFSTVQSSTDDPDRVQNFPCPVPWCDRREAGHDFDTVLIDGQGNYGRPHSADVGYLSNGPGPHNEVWVEVSAFETLSKSGSSLDVPRVTLCASSIELTAVEARQIAVWLQQAADRLDLIVGA